MPPQHRTKPFAIATGIAALALPVLAIVLSLVVPGLGSTAFYGLLWVSGVLFGVTAFLIIRWVSPPAAAPATTVMRTLVLALGWLTPAAIVVASRLSVKVCGGNNFLGLPWDPTVHAVVQVIAFVIPVMTLIALVFAYSRDSLRHAATVTTILMVFAAVPAGLAWFLTMMGQAIQFCTPV